MIGKELALDASGWRRWLYAIAGTMDIDEIIWYWHYSRYFFPYLNPTKSIKILDAGCGKGLWSFYLARHFPKSQILGIDAQAQSIVHCRDVKCAYDITNTRYQVMSFQDLNYSNEFDVVLSLFSLHYSYENDKEILGNFARALRPNGCLMLAVPYALPLERRCTEKQTPSSGKTIKYGKLIDLGEYTEHYYPEEIAAKLKKSGFENIEIRECVGKLGQLAKRIYANSQNHLPLQVATWPLALLLGWLDYKVSIRKNMVLLVRAQKALTNG